MKIEIEWGNVKPKTTTKTITKNKTKNNWATVDAMRKRKQKQIEDEDEDEHTRWISSNMTLRIRNFCVDNRLTFGFPLIFIGHNCVCNFLLNSISSLPASWLLLPTLFCCPPRCESCWLSAHWASKGLTARQLCAYLLRPSSVCHVWSRLSAVLSRIGLPSTGRPFPPTRPLAAVELARSDKLVACRHPRPWA